MKTRCEIGLIHIFGKENFKKRLKHNYEENRIEIRSNGDEKYIESILFTYQIFEDSTAIYDVLVECDKDYSVSFKNGSTPYWTYQGYVFLLNGKFNISYKEAFNIARNNGMPLDNKTLELNYSGGNVRSIDSYQWNVDLEGKKNESVWLKIHPQSGKCKESRITIILQE